MYSKPTKLDVRKLGAISNRRLLEQRIDLALKETSIQTDKTLDEGWMKFRSAVYETAKQVLGKPKRKHQYWFDQNDQHLQDLLDKRDRTHQRTLQAQATRSCTAAYKHARAELQRYTRSMKRIWWEQKAEDLRMAADRNNMREFYSPLKELWGPQK